ncbi:hypothetical protein BVRB_8g187230 [Beta vulgaris subsp. vulgaris]|nr:hypothetical protein BVRB_8g187230 [Beta vulgaris subsp. vulgaris]
MDVSKKTTNPSKIPLFIWFFEVFAVLCSCCIVISLCLIPYPPSYTLTNLNIHGIQGSDFSAQDHVEIKNNATTIMFSLLISNGNKAKDVVYGETKISLYKNGSLDGVSTLPGFVQSGRSNMSSLVLVNMKSGVRDHENEILKVGLETKVRYIVLGWITKLHLLKFEAIVPIDESGKLSLGNEGLKLKPVKYKP